MQWAPLVNIIFASVNRAGRWVTKFYFLYTIFDEYGVPRNEWDGIGREIFENSPIPWDEEYLQQVPSYDGTKIFESCPFPWDNSRDLIPWDDFFRPIPSHVEPCFICFLAIDIMFVLFHLVFLFIFGGHKHSRFF